MSVWLKLSGRYFLTRFFAAMICHAAASSALANDYEIPLAQVDLSKMAGGWYILATIPNWLERGVVAGHDFFSPQPNGEILEDFYMREGGFTGSPIHASTKITVLPNTGNADWRVHIFWPIKLPFQVLYVDPKYQFVLFGEQSRDWGWIYSRKQFVTDEQYDSMLSHFKPLGYNTDKFLKFVQTPDQIGKPGYWSENVR